MINKVSFIQTMESKYTRIDTTVPIIPHTIKTSLTPSLGMDLRVALQLVASGSFQNVRIAKVEQCD